MWPPKSPYLEVYNPNIGQDCKIAIDRCRSFSSLSEEMFAVRFYPGRYRSGWDVGLKLEPLNAFARNSFKNQKGEGFCVVVPTPRGLHDALGDVDIICYEKEFACWYFRNCLEMYERMNRLRIEYPTYGEWIIGKTAARFSKPNDKKGWGCDDHAWNTSAVLKQAEKIVFLSALFADSHEIYLLTRAYSSINNNICEISAISEFCRNVLRDR